MANKRLLSHIEKSNEIRMYDWSCGKNVSGLKWKLIKAIRSLRSIFVLAVFWRARPNEWLYTVPNANGGLVVSILVCLFARAKGFRCLLHHNSYSYLNRYDCRMHLVNLVCGKASLHIVLAPEMGQLLHTRYGDSVPWIVVPNTILLEDWKQDEVVKQGQHGSTVRLGHLSNLSVEKGIHLVVDTFRQLSDRDVELVLAGPCRSAKEREIVEAACREFPGNITYLGPIYDQDKVDFYDDIDVFLFPTEYATEAQPLVIAEAMSYGNPIIAYDRGCIASLVGKLGGQVIRAEEDFAELASKTIGDWVADPKALSAAKRSALTQAGQLRKDAQRCLSEFLTHLPESSTALPPKSDFIREATRGHSHPTVECNTRTRHGRFQKEAV